MDAPREVWLNADQIEGRRFNIVFMQVMEPTAGSDQMVRYLRADLAPSAQPAESSARERRLAEVVERAVRREEDREFRDNKHGREYAAPGWLAEARAVLASPEAPAKDPLLTIECAIGGGYEMPDGRSFWIDSPVAREMASRVAAALGLVVRR